MSNTQYTEESLDQIFKQLDPQGLDFYESVQKGEKRRQFRNHVIQGVSLISILVIVVLGGVTYHQENQRQMLLLEQYASVMMQYEIDEYDYYGKNSESPLQTVEAEFSGDYENVMIYVNQ